MKAIILDMYGVIVKQTGDEFVPEKFYDYADTLTPHGDTMTTETKV